MGAKQQSLAERWGVARPEGERRHDESPQLTLDMVKTHGGRRPGAGRPKLLRRPNVRHQVRLRRAGWIPAHITMRRVPSFPDFRGEVMHPAIVSCIRDSQRAEFRIVHYSAQKDHVHLIVEAAGEALARGMRGFATRVAKRLNRIARRSGKVWADRYHRHDEGEVYIEPPRLVADGAPPPARIEVACDLTR